MFKIGITRHPYRLRELASHSPIELILIGSREGTYADETLLHRKLAAYRKHGEWFELPEAVVWGLAKWLGRSIPVDVEVVDL